MPEKVENAKKKFGSFQYEKEYNALLKIVNPTVSFNLTLQMWNMDDRVIRDN